MSLYFLYLCIFLTCKVNSKDIGISCCCSASDSGCPCESGGIVFCSETGMLCFKTRTVLLAFTHNLRTSYNLTTPAEFVRISFSPELEFYPLEKTLLGFLSIKILQHQEWRPIIPEICQYGKLRWKKRLNQIPTKLN